MARDLRTLRKRCPRCGANIAAFALARHMKSLTCRLRVVYRDLGRPRNKRERAAYTRYMRNLIGARSI